MQSESPPQTRTERESQPVTSEASSGRTNTTGQSCFLDQKIVRKHWNLLLRDLNKHPSTAVDVLQLAGAAPRGTWTTSKCWEGTAGIATVQPDVFIFLSLCFPHLNSKMFHVVTVMHQSYRGILQRGVLVCLPNCNNPLVPLLGM